MRALNIATIVCAVTVVLAAQSAVPYHVSQMYALGGDGAWDYIVPSPSEQRLYIARTDRVMVVDSNDGHLIGQVTGIKGAHGTAIALKSGHGFATSGMDQSIVMFDLKTLQELARIPAALDADAIVYDEPSNRVFSLNGDGNSSTVVDAGTGKLVTNVPLGGKPEYGASAGDGKVYANLTDKDTVVEIDAKTATVTRRWPTVPCRQPTSMAIDATRHRLFSGCRNGTLAVSDYQAGKIVTTLPIGMGVDGAGYDPTAHDVFASNADGRLTVIHQDAADKYRVVGDVMTPMGSRNMGLDPTTHRIFVASAMFSPLATPPAGGRGRGRAAVVPGSFVLLVIEHDR